MTLRNLMDDKKMEDMEFSKQQYRTALGITNDILQACMDAGIDGIRVSKISQKANLSHNSVIYNCKRLVDADMVRTNTINRKYIFTITEKGIKFFFELQRFRDIVRQINIRY